MRQIPFFFLVVILLTVGANAQDEAVRKPTKGGIVSPSLPGTSGGVSISDSVGAIPDASSMLDVRVTGLAKKGILIPRMTDTERLAIPSPATGLLVFQTTGSSGFYYYTGSGWLALATGGGG